MEFMKDQVDLANKLSGFFPEKMDYEIRQLFRNMTMRCHERQR